jgi:hypothetical protein
MRASDASDTSDTLESDGSGELPNLDAVYVPKEVLGELLHYGELEKKVLTIFFLHWSNLLISKSLMR